MIDAASARVDHCFRRTCSVLAIAGMCVATGCSHPRPADERAALLKAPVGDAGAPPMPRVPTDQKIHGSISVGTGFGSGRGYGVGGPGVGLTPNGF